MVEKPLPLAHDSRMDEQTTAQNGCWTAIQRLLSANAERRKIVINRVNGGIDEVNAFVFLENRQLARDAVRVHQIVRIHTR
jgi:hypothetical protein